MRRARDRGIELVGSGYRELPGSVTEDSASGVNDIPAPMSGEAAFSHCVGSRNNLACEASREHPAASPSPGPLTRGCPGG
jgi:hypothetical protein